MGARCIGIRAVEARCPLICAVAVETAKTHGTTQLRRIIFFEFITLWVSKKINPPGFESCGSRKDRIDPKGNAVVTVSMLCSSSARYRCPLSPRGSTVSSLKVAKALTPTWSE